jgi:hypothetical protein
MRRLMIGVVAVGSLVAALAGLAVAQGKKAGATLSLSDGSVAAGIGFSWGKGDAGLPGQDLPGQGEGLSVGEAG